MAKKVAYVVFVGRKTGIFTSWDEVKAQVNGFPGQKQQGYTSMADAEAAWAAWTSGSGAGNTGVCSAGRVNSAAGTTGTVHKISAGSKTGAGSVEEALRTHELGENIDANLIFPHIDGPIAYTDGSYNSMLERYAYGTIIFPNPQDLTDQLQISGSGEVDEYKTANNVAGEVLGAVTAMEFALEQGWKKITIFHDYNGLAYWAKAMPGMTRRWQAKTPIAQYYQKRYDELSQMIDVDFFWVRGHSRDHYNDIVDALAKRELGIPPELASIEAGLMPLAETHRD
ncbi:MAG: ribonuclease H family protein [Lachnospiraceae bacterium]|nr:ribonuclease H family protein [Lachnospiraceae bacterium]